MTGVIASQETPNACLIGSSATATRHWLKTQPSAVCHLNLSSGAEPAGCQQTLWRDYYRRQAETHIQDLGNKISRLQKEIEDRAGNLLDERDRMIQQCLWLQNELENVGLGWESGLNG